MWGHALKTHLPCAKRPGSWTQFGGLRPQVGLSTQALALRPRRFAAPKAAPGPMPPSGHGHRRRYRRTWLLRRGRVLGLHQQHFAVELIVGKHRCIAGGARGPLQPLPGGRGPGLVPPPRHQGAEPEGNQQQCMKLFHLSKVETKTLPQLLSARLFRGSGR
jgi:hypothetical protein